MALIDGFESFSGGLPNTLPWSDQGSGSTISQSTSNVTEGTYSCRFQLTDGSTQNFSIDSGEGSFSTNLTGVATLLLDVFVADVPSDGYVQLQVFDQDENFLSDQTVEGATGADTLTLDLSTLTAPANSSILIRSRLGGSDATAYDVFVDNLRGEAGAGGALTVMDVTDPTEVIGSTYASVMGVSV